MFRFSIRDVLWLTVVVAMGLALVLSKQRQATQLRELASVRDELERVASRDMREKRDSTNMINALIRELEKDRGRIGYYSIHPDRQNPDKWNLKLQLLDKPIP